MEVDQVNQGDKHQAEPKSGEVEKNEALIGLESDLNFRVKGLGRLKTGLPG